MLSCSCSQLPSGWIKDLGTLIGHKFYMRPGDALVGKYLRMYIVSEMKQRSGPF